MKMSGRSLSVFISISAFCIFMLWFLTPINCALFLAFTLTLVAHYVKGHPLKSIITLSVLAFGVWISAPLAVNEAKQAGNSVIELIQNLTSELPELIQPLHVSEWNLEVLQSFVETDTVYTTLQLSSDWIMEIALFCSLFFIALITFVRRPDVLIYWMPSSTPNNRIYWDL
ncbi:hypothetical protein CF394_12725 [Tetzosporium hominis]|uniref:Uncharacterized protein n=1 Tax=Tetzosporium hominis TaxID=2020506 RepID=A0A264W0Z5_9BACL|nr:hypothetical protein [Tetzosporium hominis]OZS77231.1 hypothetical protein CF394_12725 [Tetzosporium hominis]